MFQNVPSSPWFAKRSPARRFYFSKTLGVNFVTPSSVGASIDLVCVWRFDANYVPPSCNRWWWLDWLHFVLHETSVLLRPNFLLTKNWIFVRSDGSKNKRQSKEMQPNADRNRTVWTPQNRKILLRLSHTWHNIYHHCHSEEWF